jgi:23S rRNA (adenine2503-C2)-methyltransferase
LRNLSGAEIYDKDVAINTLATESYQKPLSNIVMMGMGEPLLNYKEVLVGIDKITSESGLGMSPKRITLSTAGIAKMIKQLADDEVKVNLALSLHAANDDKRSSIMPINDQNNLKTLGEALNYYYSNTKQRITFEYIIFKDFNDDIEDAKQLLKFCRKVPSKVNIIEYNSIDGSEFQQAESVKVDRFAKYLESNGVVAKVRRSRGKDIDAACGQLANKNKSAKEFDSPLKQ